MTKRKYAKKSHHSDAVAAYLDSRYFFQVVIITNKKYFVVKLYRYYCRLKATSVSLSPVADVLVRSMDSTEERPASNILPIFLISEIDILDMLNITDILCLSNKN